MRHASGAREQASTTVTHCSQRALTTPAARMASTRGAGAPPLSHDSTAADLCAVCFVLAIAPTTQRAGLPASCGACTALPSFPAVAASVRSGRVLWFPRPPARRTTLARRRTGARTRRRRPRRPTRRIHAPRVAPNERRAPGHAAEAQGRRRRRGCARQGCQSRHCSRFRGRRRRRLPRGVQELRRVTCCCWLRATRGGAGMQQRCSCFWTRRVGVSSS